MNIFKKNLIIKTLFSFSSNSVKLINNQNASIFAKVFQIKPSPVAFQQYFRKQNFIEIYKIIRQSKINIVDKIYNLTALEDLCSQNQQSDLAMLTTLKSDKAQIFLGMRKFLQALRQIQQAVSLVGLRQNINPIQAAHIHRVAADVYIQLKQYPKAIRSLEQAQSILVSYDDPTIKDKLFSLSQVQTSLAMTYMNEKKFLDAKNYIDKAFDYWDQLGNKFKYPTFGNSLMLKCTIYKIFNNSFLVEQEVKQFLPYAKGPIKMWLTQFLFNQGNEEYQKQYEDLMIQEIMKLQPQRRQQLLNSLQQMKEKKRK